MSKESKTNWERISERHDREVSDGNVGIRDRSTGEGYVVSEATWDGIRKGDPVSLKTIAGAAEARDIARKAGHKSKVKLTGKGGTAAAAKTAGTPAVAGDKTSKAAKPAK